MRIPVLIVLLLAATASAGHAQESAPAVGQSTPLVAAPTIGGTAASSPSSAPATTSPVSPIAPLGTTPGLSAGPSGTAFGETAPLGTTPGLSAGPSGTAFGETAPVGSGASQGAPAPAGIAAPSAAPPVGVSVRLGNFSDILAASNAVAGFGITRAPGLTVTPSIGLQEELTSNAQGGTGGGNQGDLITTITPGILINLATPHAVGTLAYSPSAQIYAKQSDNDNISQQFNGSLQVELLPQTLFLTLEGFVSEQNTFGSLVPGGVNNISPNNRTTSTGFLINPSFVHQFGEGGTLRLGYSLSESSNSGNEAFLPSATQPFFTSSHALTNQGTASFTTGPSLGRLNDVIAASAAESTGTGILNGAHQYVFSDTARYALLRQFYVFGTVGYENIFYSSLPPVRIEDAIWAGGVTLLPRPGTTITVGYGHFEGIDSPFVNATIALSARTTLAVSYSDLLGTSLQSLQSGLANSIVSPSGTPVNSQTGIPVLFSNQMLSVQSGLFRDQLFSATLISAWPRNVYSLSFIDENQKLVANAADTFGFSQSSVSGSIGWSHVLSPSLTSVAYLQGGTTSAPTITGSTSSPTFASQFSLLDRITPSLTGSVSLQFTNQWQNFSGNAFQASLILALQKVF